MKEGKRFGLLSISIVNLSRCRILYPKNTRTTNTVLTSSKRNVQLSNYADTGVISDMGTYIEIENNARSYVLK